MPSLKTYIQKQNIFKKFIRGCNSVIPRYTSVGTLST